MALAAQLQQDEYDAEDQALQRRTQNNNRYGSQNAYSHTQAPRSDEQATVATQQQSSGGLGQSDSPSGPGGTRPENINPKVLAGLGARTPKKQKEKSSEGKKSKKDCIIC